MLLPDAEYIDLDAKNVKAEIDLNIEIELEEKDNKGEFKQSKTAEDGIKSTVKQEQFAEKSFTYSEALSTEYFWAVSLTCSFLAAAVTGFNFYIVDILNIFNMQEQAHVVYPLLAFSSVLVKIPVGAMLD